MIAVHIRARHYSELQELKNTRAKDWNWRTASGRIINFGNDNKIFLGEIIIKLIYYLLTAAIYSTLLKKAPKIF